MSVLIQPRNLGRALFFLLLAAVSTQANARILRVPANYPTIQLAVNAAHPGDTVQVWPGSYVENVVITTPNLKVLANGPQFAVNIQDGGDGTVVTINAPRVRLHGFYITGGDTGVLATSDFGKIDNNIVTQQTTFGINVVESRGIVLDENNAGGSPTGLSYTGIQVLTCTAVRATHNGVGDAIFGLAFTDSTGRVDHNFATFCEFGILMESEASEIDHNTTFGCDFAGLYCLFTDNGSIHDNVAILSFVHGIFVDTCRGNIIKHNSGIASFTGFDLISTEDESRPDNIYRENYGFTAFPSLDFWDVR
jgi:parallel beta-helix repeat protein